MQQEFERIAPRLYRRSYETADGAESVLFYARFVCKLKGKRRLFALGGDLKQAKDLLKDLDYRNRHREDFDLGKIKAGTAPVAAEKAHPMTVAEWVPVYLDREETKALRSYDRIRQLTVPLLRLLGSMALVDLTHDDLAEYVSVRKREFVIRNNKPSKVAVKMGTIANELSCLRAMLNSAFLAKDKKIVGTRERQYPGLEGFTVNVSFRGLIVRSQRERVLDTREEKALLEVYPAWLRRVCVFAVETCLSQGDVIRLTKSMIDYTRNEIVPTGGRLKTGVKQRAPLTRRARAVLEEIEADRRAGRIVANVNGLVFTRDNGAAITRNAITGAGLQVP